MRIRFSCAGGVLVGERRRAARARPRRWRSSPRSGRGRRSATRLRARPARHGARERGGDLVGIAQEDVAPDGGVRARESRHLAERGAGERERRVVVRRRLGDASMSRFASAWGRWLVSASRRSWASASVRTVRAPSEETKRSTSATLSAEDASVGVRNQVASSNRSAAARAGPPVAPPATGWPGTKRGILDRRERALGRGDVGHDDAWPGGGQHLPHDGRSRADRNRDDHELRVRDRLRERLRRLERAARRRVLEHAGVRVEAAACGCPRGRRRARPTCR